MNKVLLIGNLTRDPELKFTPQGTAVAKLGIAVNRQYKGSDGEWKKQTDFFNIIVWGKSGENCSKFLTKGRSVFVEGRLQTRSYETQDKQKRTVVEVVADRVEFLGGGSGAPARNTNEDSPSSEATSFDPGDSEGFTDPSGDVPF
ncbi:MAG: single-stranded DNA-binding protein [Candidatus Riflebacteria bacterium]|nr:single-stranded DNA-binding protein [Candidatus Riflebacteria bacterium]